MSATEKRPKAKRLEVPDLEDDPAERKRVLNVLAQRRYRRRKKEHVQRLEKLTHQEVLPSADPQLTEDVNQVEFSPTQMSCFDQFSSQPPYNVYAGDQHFSTGASITPSNLEESFGFDSTTLEAFDPSLNFPLPSLPTTPSLTTASPTSQNTMTRTSSPQSMNFDQNYNFPDEVNLPILELDLFRATMAIAKRLEVDSIMWSLDANSLFHNSTSLTFTHLPMNLRPTAVQLRVPHHPMLDILPWPSVRDRLIIVFSQPEDLRPPCARGPNALVDFVYDLEDSADGARIAGDDPYSDDNWEVGEKLFKNWWWALNGRIIHRSNQLRRDRGASLLGMKKRVEEVDCDPVVSDGHSEVRIIHSHDTFMATAKHTA